MKFKVKIVRTTVTEITVEAPTKAAARREIVAYGLDLAAMDYPAVDLGGDAFIRSIAPIEIS